MKSLLFTLLLAIVTLPGCQESQKKYGQGDLPPDWQEFFGKNNISRLGFNHEQVLDQQNKILSSNTKTVEDLSKQIKRLDKSPELKVLMTRITMLENPDHITSEEKKQGWQECWTEDNTRICEKVIDPDKVKKNE